MESVKLAKSRGKLTGKKCANELLALPLAMLVLLLMEVLKVVVMDYCADAMVLWFATYPDSRLS